MLIKPFIHFLLYFGLLVGAFVFVQNSFVDYLSGSTSYSDEEEAITLQDLPTVTICLEYFTKLKRLTYGKNMSLSVIVKEKDENMATLIENRWVASSVDIQLHLEELQLSAKMEDSLKSESENRFWYQWQCYKVTAKWDSTSKRNIDFGLFNMQFSMEFNESVIEHRPPRPPLNWYIFRGVRVALTSEDNSYGITKGQWLDGEIKLDNTLKPQRVLCSQLIKIAKVTEYRNIDSICSQDSYYSCLGKRLEKVDINTSFYHTTDSNNCSLKAICRPFSLPFQNNQNLACRDEIDRKCQEDVITALEENMDIYCKKSCPAKEYAI